MEVPVLGEMQRSGKVVGTDGATYPLTSGIDIGYAQVLHDLVLREKPETVVEIGFANGVSTLSILSALDALGGNGRLISIDPAQTGHWHGAGLENVVRSGFAARHHLIEAPNFLALPALLKQKIRIDLAYVDGTHTFDHVLLDFFYLDKMVPVGRIVGFNDCIYPAIHRVLRFVSTHRKYEEIDVGLPRDFSGRYGVFSRVVRRVQDRIPADRYYRKLQDFEPEWDFYKSF